MRKASKGDIMDIMQAFWQMYETIIRYAVFIAFIGLVVGFVGGFLEAFIDMKFYSRRHYK